MFSKFSDITLGLIFLLFSGILFAQTKGKLVVAVAPSNSVVFLDSDKLNMDKIYLDVALGSHIIKTWAPKRKLYIDTINILANKTFIYSKKLKYSDEYLNYRRDLRHYYIRKFSPYAALFLYGSLYYSAHLAGNKYYESAINEKTLYDSSIGITTVNDHKGKFNNYKNIYGKLIITENALAIGTLVIAPLCGYFIWKSIKETKPSFIEKQLLAASFDFRSDPVGRKNISLCLNYSF